MVMQLVTYNTLNEVQQAFEVYWGFESIPAEKAMYSNNVKGACRVIIKPGITECSHELLNILPTHIFGGTDNITIENGLIVWDFDVIDTGWLYDRAREVFQQSNLSVRCWSILTVLSVIYVKSLDTYYSGIIECAATDKYSDLVDTVSANLNITLTYLQRINACMMIDEIVKLDSVKEPVLTTIDLKDIKFIDDLFYELSSAGIKYSRTGNSLLSLEINDFFQMGKALQIVEDAEKKEEDIEDEEEVEESESERENSKEQDTTPMQYFTKVGAIYLLFLAALVVVMGILSCIYDNNLRNSKPASVSAEKLYERLTQGVNEKKASKEHIVNLTATGTKFIFDRDGFRYTKERILPKRLEPEASDMLLDLNEINSTYYEVNDSDFYDRFEIRANYVNMPEANTNYLMRSQMDYLVHLANKTYKDGESDFLIEFNQYVDRPLADYELSFIYQYLRHSGFSVFEVTSALDSVSDIWWVILPEER